MDDYNDDYAGYSQVSVTSLPKIVSRKKDTAVTTSITSTTTTTTTSTSSATTSNNSSTISTPTPSKFSPKIVQREIKTTSTTSTTSTSVDKKSTSFAETINSTSIASTPSIQTTPVVTSSSGFVQEITDDTDDDIHSTIIDTNGNGVDDEPLLIPLPLEEQESMSWDPWDNNSCKDIDRFLESRIKKSFQNKNNITPRDHQWKTIRNIIKDLAYPQHQDSFQGKRYNYLIQHAAGSGKSITIATLVYCLYKLEINNKLKFDTIVIMNDRSQLDAQLGDVIVKFLEANGITNYCRPKSSKQLQTEISYGKRRIVITTMQKFAQLLPTKNGSGDFSFKTNSVAIISDEAHRSHGKSTTERLHEFLVGKVRQTSQITYFSFTCTPTPQCLEMFGVASPGRDKKPFYTYSMEDALKDKLILDVIENFSAFHIKDCGLSNLYDGKYWDDDYYYDDDENSINYQDYSIDEDKRSIQEKCVYILNHFVETKKKYDTDKFKSRGMIVCSGRKKILDYKKTIDEIVAKLPAKDQFDTIAAFSPFVLDGKTIVESDTSVNGKYAPYGTDKHRGIVKALLDDKNCKIRLMIVADKLQTGFDEPSLCMMYVDKKISGANVVQTLSRLSRISNDKKSTSIIDFINNEKEVRQIFRIYQKSTTLRSLTGDSQLVSRLYSTASAIKKAYSKERNITVFARSILYHQKEGEKQYRELEGDLEEFIDCYEQLVDMGTNLKDLNLPIDYDTLKTLQKTLHNLKEQNLKKEREKVTKRNIIKIRMDYLTDKEANSSLESSSNVDYDADFAAQLWADQKNDSFLERKEKEVARLKELTRKLQQEKEQQDQQSSSSFSFSSGSGISRYKLLNSHSSSSSSSSNGILSSTSTTPLNPPLTKRKESVWSLARKTNLGKRAMNDDNNTGNGDGSNNISNGSPQPLKKQNYYF